MSAPKISEAVVLMAGSGSRLRADDRKMPKPLVPVLGRPLISYTLTALAEVGIKTVHAVVGFERDLVKREVARIIPSRLEVRFVENLSWQKQNGISVLAAADFVRAPFLLTMSDHLFDRAILERLLEEAGPNELSLAIDRKVNSIFDLDDAMKVRTAGDRLIAIGKDLDRYDAIDTGLFVCPLSLFDHLRAEEREGDCSLSDGVRAMGRLGLARAVDIGEAWWQDVDTAAMHAAAENHLRYRTDAKPQT